MKRLKKLIWLMCAVVLVTACKKEPADPSELPIEITGITTYPENPLIVVGDDVEGELSLKVAYKNGWGRKVVVSVSPDGGIEALQPDVELDLTQGADGGTVNIPLKGTVEKQNIALLVTLSPAGGDTPVSKECRLEAEAKGVDKPVIGITESGVTPQIMSHIPVDGTNTLRVFYSSGLEYTAATCTVSSGDWGISGELEDFILTEGKDKYFDVPLLGSVLKEGPMPLKISLQYQDGEAPVEVTLPVVVIGRPIPQITANSVLFGQIKSHVPVGAYDDVSLKVYYTNGFNREGVTCTVTGNWGVSGELNNIDLSSGNQESYFEVPLQGTAQENGEKSFTVSITYDQSEDPVTATVNVLVRVDELDTAKGRARILGALFSDGNLKDGVWRYATPSKAIINAQIKAATDFLGTENFESFYNENTGKYRINLYNTPWTHGWESEEPDDFAKYLPEFIVAVIEGEGNKNDGMIIDDPNETHAMTMVNMCNYHDIESYLWKNGQVPPNYFKGYAYEKDWPKLQAFPFAGYGRCPGGKPEVVEYAPSALIISLDEGKTVSGEVSVNVLARDITNVEADHVILYVDNIEKGSDSISPFSITLDTGTIGNGTATVRVKAVAANGKYSYSPPVKVNVNN